MAGRIEPFQGRPLLDIASYGRAGSRRRDRLSPAQIAQIARTVGRTPEVMVKVLSHHSNNLSSVAGHFDYIGRDGELELETDEAEQMSGKRIGRTLIDDWNLDLETHRRSSELTAGKGRPPAKLVHKLMFSMPAGAPPQAVLNATKTFLREEFALKHRYAFVLHTDEPHPHVHAVVKAMSEQGERLNIRKATLRGWRAEFARHLRAQGVAANATERAVRGQVRKAKLDPIYRAVTDPRRISTHEYKRVLEIGRAVMKGAPIVERGKAQLKATRHRVTNGWLRIADLLHRQGEVSLAQAAMRFAERMPAVNTEAERIAAGLRDLVSQRTRVRSR